MYMRAEKPGIGKSCNFLGYARIILW